VGNGKVSVKREAVARVVEEITRVHHGGWGQGAADAGKYHIKRRGRLNEDDTEGTERGG
jgi:hypothetical protein